MDVPLRVDLREMLGRGGPLPPIMGGDDPGPPDETVPKKDHDDLLERFKKREKALTKAQGEAKTVRTDLETVLTALGIEELPEDPDERKQAIERVMADRKGGKVVPKDEVDRILDAERKKWVKEREGLDQREQTRMSTIRRLMIENAAMSAATELNATEGGADAIRYLIREEADILEIDGELRAIIKGKDGPRHNAKGEHLTIKERIAEISTEAKYADWFRAGGRPGGGTPPATPPGTNRNGQMRVTREQLGDTEFYRKHRDDIDKARRENRLEIVGT